MAVQAAGDQDFTISPYILVAGETSGGADAASSFGGIRGIYMELGIDPGYTVDFTKNWSARFHLPFVLGFSLDKYYEVATSTGVRDKAFGYADLGIAADISLKFMPARFGKWTFSTFIFHSGCFALSLSPNSVSLWDQQCRGLYSPPRWT